MNVRPTGEEENWDMEDSQSAAGHQFQDVIIEEAIESVTEEELGASSNWGAADTAG